MIQKRVTSQQDLLTERPNNKEKKFINPIIDIFEGKPLAF